MITRENIPRWSVVAALVVVLVGAPYALAGGTDPLLAIGQVTARAAGSGSVVRLRGTWEFDNLLQVDFPLTLVASQGDFFVRVPMSGATAATGTFAGLSDGLDSLEISVLESLGSPENDAAVLGLDRHEIVVALPDSITNGDVSVVLYVELANEGGFVSNALVTSLVGVAP